MSNKPKASKKRTRRILPLLLVPLLLLFFLAGSRPFAHRHSYFTPDYPRLDLGGLLAGGALSGEDYETLFLQTGLGPAAVDAYLAMGEAGVQQILQTQEAFFRPPHISCDSLGPVTWEDHQTDGAGNLIRGFPMAPLEDADALFSFSTHTLGWRHGHAGLVVDAGENATLEAVLIGSDSATVDAGHWSVYATFLHLRLRDITPEQQSEIAAFAKTHLDRIPYHLTSGIFSPAKAQDPESDGLGAQCAYLVWYALYQAGYDTDSDGGRIVTVADLAASPLFEVVQVYGLDPRLFPQARTSQAQDAG